MTRSVARWTLGSCPAFLGLAFLAFCSAPLLGQESMGQQPVAAPAPDSPPAVSNEPAEQTNAPGVRIVRLSEVKGDAQLDRKTDRGFETAFANLPITQGARLRTGEGITEVEFEDNSSLRMTPHSLVEFPVLSLHPDGTRTSTVRVLEGTVYVSLTKSKENNFNLLFGKETIALAPAAHVELTVGQPQSRLDVLDGSATATNGTTTTEVSHKKALVFDGANPGAPTLESKIEKGPYDAWDKQSVDYHNHFAQNGHLADTPYNYGLADLNYYGAFASYGGCGSMWYPYLASANWSPYANGVWAYYPDAGYSWVSPYPWGWLPFHSGSWDYCPNTGWGWRPNGQWHALRNYPKESIRVPGGKPTPIRPPFAPRPLAPGLVPVGEKPLVISTISNTRQSFVFRNDSAGLGVPRGTFGNLHSVSTEAGRHGFAETPVEFTGNNGLGARQMATNRGAESGGRNSATARSTATALTGNSFTPSHTASSPGMSSGGGHYSSGGGGSFSGGGGHVSGGASAGGGGSAGGSSGGHH